MMSNNVNGVGYEPMRQQQQQQQQQRLPSSFLILPSSFFLSVDWSCSIVSRRVVKPRESPVSRPFGDSRRLLTAHDKMLYSLNLSRRHIISNYQHIKVFHATSESGLRFGFQNHLDRLISKNLVFIKCLFQVWPNFAISGEIDAPRRSNRI